jgi:SAM-dependent methyltransferase
VDLSANAERFSGFADLYDRVRPSPPEEAAGVLCRYARSDAPRVVDLGCGTGLSTRWCASWAQSVIGVEPSDDMRELAAARSLPNVQLVAGWSHATGLPAASADIVVAVQALHWMEPASTFDEVARVLRPGGVFASLDCDWPPSVGDERVEAAWIRCHSHARHLEAELGDRARAWAKDQHLSRMRASTRFAACTEMVMHREELADATRFVDLLRSQGDLQSLRKRGLSDEQLGLTVFAAAVRQCFGDRSVPVLFGYRMRVGITP